MKSKAAPPPAAGATGSRSIYRDSFDAAQAMADLGPLQAALAGQPFGVRLDREAGLPPHRFTLRLFHPQRADRARRHPAAGRNISASGC